MAKRLAMKLARAGKGFTQLSLAEKIGCSERDITLLETGRSSPTYGLACRISETLGDKLETLFPEFVPKLKQEA